MKNIKIFVACHRNSNILKSKYLYPIQVGAALANEHFDGMIHDDDGDNISLKNKMYCEMTAHYYAWKNQEADYYGFFHYRRYLSFGKDRSKAYLYPKNFSNFEKDYGYSDKHLEKIITSYDLIVPMRDDLNTSESLYEHYEKSWFQNIKDLDIVLDIIKNKYPEMYDCAIKSTHATSGYFCNMFIMKKELFFESCEWVFDILAEHEKLADFSNYSMQAMRVSGYLGERLTNIFINWIISQKKFKVLELPTLFFTDASFITDVQKPIRIDPVFKKTDCALFLAANEYYVPYLSSLLTSIYDNRNVSNNYDIIVLNTDISERNIQTMQAQFESDKSFSLRFVNMRNIINQYPNLPTHGHFKVETYYRFFILDIAPKYEKILYLDSDMIVKADIAKLFAENIDGYLVGACADADTAGLYNGFEPNKKHYSDNILKIKKPFEYFQAGTILFNLKEMRKSVTSVELINFALSNHWELLDQDVLNYFCQGKVKFLDMSWNYMIDMYGKRKNEIISLAPANLYYQYEEAEKNPKIVHYAGPEKPWLWPLCDKFQDFWHYCRKTPYYEIALNRAFDNNIHANKVINNYYIKQRKNKNGK